jgi:hypothetical protein
LLPKRLKFSPFLVLSYCALCLILRFLIVERTHQGAPVLMSLSSVENKPYKRFLKTPSNGAKRLECSGLPELFAREKGIQALRTRAPRTISDFTIRTVSPHYPGKQHKEPAVPISSAVSAKASF